MALVECKPPVFDRQVEQILFGLEEGKCRKEIAEELGYSNPISLDNYMRRRNFSWDSRQKNFVPAAERYSAKARYSEVPLHGTSKVDLVISLFSQGELDAKDIAIQVGFSNHRELAEYMKSKHYAWDATNSNYFKEEGSTVAIDTPAQQQSPQFSVGKDIGELYPILQLLQQNSGRIQGMLQDDVVKEMPRYALPGSFACKTVHMAESMDRLVRAYSKEKNISQRELFEVALIDFFRRYGYMEHINQLLDEENR